MATSRHRSVGLNLKDETTLSCCDQFNDIIRTFSNNFLYTGDLGVFNTRIYLGGLKLQLVTNENVKRFVNRYVFIIERSLKSETFRIQRQTTVKVMKIITNTHS